MFDSIMKKAAIFFTFPNIFAIIFPMKPLDAYVLGSRPYKRFLKGPCELTEYIPQKTTGYLVIKTYASRTDTIDTKGIKNRKNCHVVLLEP